MQGLPSIGDGGGGQLFGSGGGPDRRLRQLQHQTSTKCPRCDSPDTKFCYYNNYNLSQPRHFCRTCKRYWTNGGLLRNVPVGGGCRKPKRSKPKPSGEDDRKANSPSSTDSSSLTVATTASAAFTDASTLLDFPDSSLFGGRQNSNPRFDPPLTDLSTDGGVLTEIGSFPSVMTSSDDPSLLGLNTTGVSAPAYRLHQQSQGTFLENQSSNQKIAGYMPKDPTAQIDLSGQCDKANNCGVGAPDWGAGGDQRLIDFTRTVDQAYWSQSQCQWTDEEHPLYLQ